MKVFAIHDATGVISSIVTAPDDGPSVTLGVDPVLAMSEIQVPADLLTGNDDEEALLILAERLSNYRVAIEKQPTTLIPVDGQTS